MTGIELIQKERAEQINKHGRSADFDLEHNNDNQLAIGALMLLAVEHIETEVDPKSYPKGWDNGLCAKMIAKPYRDRLVIAAALIAAEIDRIQSINVHERTRSL